MRPALFGVLAAAGLVAAAVLHDRLRLDPFAHARAAPAGPLVRTPLAADVIVTSEPGLGVIAFRVPLPPGTTGADSLALRFREPLDGARVDAFGDGPHTHATLLRKRIGGDTVLVPMPLGAVEAVEVRVHRNLRPPPLVRDVALLTAASDPAPATPAAAADPPRAASPRSTR